MILYLSWDGDGIGKQAGLARLNDDLAEVRRVSNAIDAGNALWVALAERSGTHSIEAGGDEGAIELPVDKLPEVPGIASQYRDAVGATCSVGIGTKLSESSKALLVAKLRGKDRIVLWEPEMQSEIDAANAHPKTEEEKLGEEYLGKHGGNQGTHAGFAGHTTPGEPHIDKPTSGQKDHSAASVTEHVIQNANDAAANAPQPQQPDDDFESQLHSAAQDQEKQDRDSVIEDDAGLDQLKKQLVQTLAGVKAQMPILSQMKAAAPEAYQTIMSLVQGLIALGRQVMKDQPAVSDEDPQHIDTEVKKSDDRDDCADCGAFLGVNIDCLTCEAYADKHWGLKKSVAGIQAGPKTSAGAFDYSHILPDAAKQAGITMHLTHAPASHPSGEHLQVNLHHNGQPIGNTTGYVRSAKDSKGIEPHSELESAYRGGGLGQAMHEATYAHAKNVLGIGHVQFGPHSEDAHKMLQSLARKHGFEYQAHSDPKMARYGYGFTPGSYAIKSEAEEPEESGPGFGSVFIREDLSKSVAQIQPGKRSLTPGRVSFDYSHVLSPEHKALGLQMHVTHVAPSGPVGEHTITTLQHHEGGKHKVVGSVTAYIDGKKGDKSIEPHSMLLPKFQGKGLGQSMYEASYAHAKNALGISRVEGGMHSDQAHSLHQRLAAKHGFEYSSTTPADLAGTDYPHSPYSYAIKDEMAPNIDDCDIVGPGKGVTFHRGEIVKDEMDGSPPSDDGELDKAGGGGGREAGRQHLKLPVGSMVDQKIKTTRADGHVGWTSVASGMIQGQQGDPLGNPHAVSSRKPGAK